MRVILQPTGTDSIRDLLNAVADIVPSADPQVGHGGIVLDEADAHVFLAAVAEVEAIEADHPEPGDESAADADVIRSLVDADAAPPVKVLPPAVETPPVKKTAAPRKTAPAKRAARKPTTRTGE